MLQNHPYAQYFFNLRSKIIQNFESFEKEKRFVKTPWDHVHGGGGEIGLLRGEVFEKAAVNFSCVEGKTFPTGDAQGPFRAMGISLITHMHNPKAPTVHFNLRYIETQTSSWFGGGYDLTPMGITYEEDTNHFHDMAKQACKEHWEEFFNNAKNYFYIKHRKKERGVGGIFFDHFNTKDPTKDFALIQNIGDSFLEAILPIYQRRIHEPFTSEDKALQNRMRAHYVEFNLIYDRGTRFGFLSDGNPDAILCSMPPSASW